MALLWRSQFPPEGFTSLVRAVDVQREWRDDRRELRIMPADTDQDLQLDPYWTYDCPPGGDKARGSGDRTQWTGWSPRDVGALRRQERFLCGHDEDVLLHAVEPIADAIPQALAGFGGYWPDRAPSAAHALLRLMLLPQDADPTALLEAYRTCLTVNAIAFGPYDDVTRPALDEVVLRRLANDQQTLGDEAVAGLLGEIDRIDHHRPEHRTRFHGLVTRILPRNG